MSVSAPFLFAKLDERPAATNVAKEQGSQSGESGVQQSKQMVFEPFGADPQAASEPALLYTADDLARAVDEARRTTAIETEAALRMAMADDIEQRRSDLLPAIKDQLTRHQSTFEEEIARLSCVSRDLALALAKAVIPRAIERQPLIDITEALRGVLTRLAKEPALELRLPPDLVEAGQTLLDELVNEAGFQGAATALADPAMGKGDAELRWKGGVLDRRLDRLCAEALELVDRWLDVPSKATADAEIVPPSQSQEDETPNKTADQSTIRDQEMSEPRHKS